MLDYVQLFTTISTGLQNFVVDSNGNPYLDADSIVGPEAQVTPSDPHVILYVPFSVNEDNIGHNPPVRHAEEPVITSEILANGTVDVAWSTGNTANKLLWDYQMNDFQDLDIQTEPKAVRPGDEVINTTTGKTSPVRAVIEPQIIEVKDPIFPNIGEEYEIRRLDARVIYWSGRVITIQASAESSYNTSGNDPIEQVDQIADQIHDYFAIPSKGNFDLCEIGFTVNRGGLGQISRADYGADQGSGTSQRIFRRDFRVELFAVDELTDDRDDLITRTIGDIVAPGTSDAQFDQ